MRTSVDVPGIVTGLIVLGATAVGAWLLSGREVIGPPAMWFATVLITAGIVGLVVSLRSGRR